MYQNKYTGYNKLKKCYLLNWNNYGIFIKIGSGMKMKNDFTQIYNIYMI